MGIPQSLHKLAICFEIGRGPCRSSEWLAERNCELKMELSRSGTLNLRYSFSNRKATGGCWILWHEWM